jgi:hypothetical protein
MELEQQAKQLFAKASKEFKDLELKKKELENEAEKLKKQLAQERESHQTKLNEEAVQFRLNLAKEKEKLLTEAKTKLEEANKLEMKLAEEKNRVQDQNLRAAKKVLLDVGGVFYATSLTTLTSQTDSMLAGMFSGRFPFEKDENGRIFIDRSGALFGIILDWLRNGTLPFLQAQEKQRLSKEADYYGLQQLVKQLKTEVFSEIVVQPLQLESGWQNQSSSSISIQKQGKICLVTGIIQNNRYNQYQQNYFTKLPEGFRPKEELQFSAPNYVRILPNGEMQSLQNANTIQLNGIVFMTE